MYEAGAVEWSVFAIAVTLMLLVDLADARRGQTPTVRSAAVSSGVWIGISMLFGGFVALRLGREAGLTFLSAYTLEKSLSIDNLFVFTLIFAQTGIAPALQRRALYWGIVSALSMRAVMIAAGVALLDRFHWMIYRRWAVDKYVDGVRLHQSFDSFEDAEARLTRELEALRQRRVHGAQPQVTFDQAAGRFIEENRHLASIESYAYHLKAVMPLIGDLILEQVHSGTLQPFVEARLKGGASHKTINLSLAAVRRVLNLAARTWRDEASGKPWLLSAPLITMLPLTGNQRPPRPITWQEQEMLLQELPEHLREMALFVLNTGVRDDVVCNLQWDWEIPVPELGISVFETPVAHVKGRRTSKLVVCNSVSQAVIERARGRHPTHVFVMAWRHRALGPVQTMNNSAWQSARSRAGLGDLHVHDLRHTVGMRLREAGVSDATRADVLWHSNRSITDHYSMAQIRELHDALEKITQPSSGWNKSLQALKAENALRKARSVAGNRP